MSKTTIWIILACLAFQIAQPQLLGVLNQDDKNVIYQVEVPAKEFRV